MSGAAPFPESSRRWTAGPAGHQDQGADTEKQHCEFTQKSRVRACRREKGHRGGGGGQDLDRGDGDVVVRVGVAEVGRDRGGEVAQDPGGGFPDAGLEGCLIDVASLRR